MAAAAAEHVAKTETSEKNRADELEALKTAHQTQVESLSSEKDSQSVEHAAAVEKLCAEHATLVADAEAKHEGAITAHSEELAAVRSKATQDIDELTTSLQARDHRARGRVGERRARGG